MFKAERRALRLFALTLAAGTCLQFGGCLRSVSSYARNFNPCGTFLACDPVEYEFLTSGYQGPGVNPDIDPTCTYPPYCEDDPFVATINP